MARKQKKAPGASTTTQTVDTPRMEHAPAQRWQRGAEFHLVAPDGDGPRSTQRIYDSVAQLWDAHRIGDAEVAAAARWTKDFERHQRSPHVEPATAGIRGGGGGGPELVLVGGIDASWRREEAAAAVGAEGTLLMRALAVEGRSFGALARLAGKSRGTASQAISAEFVKVLFALSAHYAHADRPGYRGILDPARRPPERTRELTAAERMPA